jgi:HEAT repeat protein
VEAIIPLLNDKDWSVRETSVKVLGQLKDPGAGDPLIEIIKNQNEQLTIRLGALDALLSIDEAKVSPLLPILLSDQQRKVRIYAAKTIAKLSLKNYIPLMEERLKVENNPKVSEAITSSIRQLNEKK